MVRLENVTVAFGDKTVLNGLSASLPETGVVAVTGASGSGKTTLLRVLAGLRALDGGAVTGLPKRVSYVFQEDRLLPWLTALENAALADGAGNADKILGELELSDAARLYPRELSGGMKRRVAIARALAFGGDMLLLDEPFAGLDAELRARVAARIRGAFPLTVISTHDLDEARLLGEPALVLRV